MSPVTRETLIMQSVQDYIKDVLFNQRSYDTAKTQFLDSFPYNRWRDGEQLDKNYVAVGFNFDDGGQAGELGSSLIRRNHTIEFFVFGINALWGSNLAHAVKEAAEIDDRIPLKAVDQVGQPVIDQLLVIRSSAERQIIPDPEPFQQFIWTTHLIVQDEYMGTLV